MIGLLGTVIGMIGAFSVLGSAGISDPRALAARIGEVLLATASGLFIAIPAFVFYYVFRNLTQACVVHGDDIVNELVQDIPYAELEGMRIGQEFSAGAGAVLGAECAPFPWRFDHELPGLQWTGGRRASIPCPHLRRDA